MKHIYKAIAVCLLSLPLSMAVYAAENEMPGMNKHEGMPMPGMGMQHDGMMEKMMSPEHLKEMQAHILLMHDLSNKILAEKDPKKQQALKDQQLEVMKAHMAEKMAKRHQMKMSHPAPVAPDATKK